MLSTGAGSLLAIHESSRLASEQIAESNAAGRSGPGRILRVMGNLWTAGADTIGARLSGRVHFGTFPAQMAGSMKEKAAGRKIDREARHAREGGAPGTVGPGEPKP